MQGNTYQLKYPLPVRKVKVCEVLNSQLQMVTRGLFICTSKRKKE